MASVLKQLVRVLASDPGFDGPYPDGAVERAADLKAFEQQIGMVMPDNVRVFMVEMGCFDVAPRLFNGRGERKTVVPSEAYFVPPGWLQRTYDTLVPFFLDQSRTDAQKAWSAKLVPVLIDNDDQYFVLDFSYSEVEPPLLTVSMETPWESGRGRFIAPSLLDYLRNPIWESVEYYPTDLADIPSEESLAWTSWYEENLGQVDWA